MATLSSSVPATRRSLLLRDSLVFLALCGVSIALFLVTLFLFRSFEAHREDLGVRWAKRGEAALQNGHPAEAVSALRTALSYRDNLPAQLMLAEALADAGHTEEATNYFLNLRETRPGDGFINLQLARLYRKQGEQQLATDDYRASIFGSWQGDGAVRRREVRLELAEYLAEQGDRASARDELLVAAGNVPETPGGDALIADRLQGFGYRQDALNFYAKALKLAPRDRTTLVKAGRIAYGLGQYESAYRYLNTALNTRPAHGAAMVDNSQIAALAADAHRVPELNLSRDLPAAERAQHLLLAGRIAEDRLQSCMAIIAPPIAPTASNKPETNTGAKAAAPADVAASTSSPETISALQILHSRWLAASHQLTQRTLERDAALEDNIMQLINDTEVQTVAPCGTPHGDDALLLMLANGTAGSHP